ncbi:GNAT family N-acetyltransferase [Methanolobus bombayensis]|uniref:GNAT family N-acetyltransferase n=1 Tax=Methanolobus bombayensis TaxID=38023 RepID=UPI001AE7DEE2|nr:GNAT family N-acetyltransferase [Methanolobus bombayensis]MBP1910254.1 ribosomal protein S18 acetylase RimI-like enzyme [Methanolobus bombayensis]
MSVKDLNILHVAGNIQYGVLETGSSIDQLDIDIGNASNAGFNYFHNKFGMPYDFLLKSSISSGHSLFIAIQDENKLLGFARFEQISEETERTYRGKTNVVNHSIHLLRSIEIHPSHRHVGIGRLLFAIAVKHLKSNVITMPDNPGASRFFKEKLRFKPLNPKNSGLSSRYEGYLILQYPRAKNMLKTMAGNYPRMVMPELIGSYEALKFRHNMGKNISSEDISDFLTLFESSRELLDNKLKGEMNSFIRGFDFK